MYKKITSMFLFLIVFLTYQYTYSGCFDSYGIVLKGVDKQKIDEINVGLGESQTYEVAITPDGSSFTGPNSIIINNSKSNGMFDATSIGNNFISLKGTSLGSADLEIDIPCPTGNISKTFKVNVVEPETMDHFDFGLIPRTEKIPNTNNYQYIKKTKRFKIDFGSNDPSRYNLFTCELWLEAFNKNTQRKWINHSKWEYYLLFDAQVNTEFLPRSSSHVGTIEICSKYPDDSDLIKSKVNVIVSSSDTIVIDMQILSQDVNVNGNPSKISTNEVPRLILKGGRFRTYIPLRLVANYCNMIVDYVDQPGIARILANDLSITVPIKPKAQALLPWVTRTQYTKPNKLCVENKQISSASFTTSYVGPSNVAATIVDNTGLIELRAILESFGAQVIWADGSKTIRIIYRPGWTSGI